MRLPGLLVGACPLRYGVPALHFLYAFWKTFLRMGAWRWNPETPLVPWGKGAEVALLLEKSHVGAIWRHTAIVRTRAQPHGTGLIPRSEWHRLRASHSASSLLNSTCWERPGGKGWGDGGVQVPEVLLLKVRETAEIPASKSILKII